MTRLLSKPQPLRVKTNVEGVPTGLIRKGRVERITEVHRRWRIADQLWEGEVAREYFMISTDRGLICDICRDMITDAWYLSRIYD